MKPISNRGFRRLKRVEVARRLLLDFVGDEGIPRVESVEVENCVGRILAQRVSARRYLPPFDLAIVDGYAVRSHDLRQASSKHPAVLRVVGESRLGEECRLRIRKGQAVVVATGSMVPNGSDAVVMVEHARTLPENRVAFRSPISPWQGITRKGEDVQPGKVVLDRAIRIRPEDIGALKALGLTSVRVVRKVRVGVLSTGNELVNSPRKESRAKIVDLNRPILSEMLRQLGAEPVDMGIVKDDERAIKAALKSGLAKTDMVIVTAGSSVGKRDLVPNCINSLGKPGMLVHGVAMRPAMPTGLAVVRGKPVVSLPGFPVSAMIAFRAFVRPLLAKLVGAPEPLEPIVNATLRTRIIGSPNHRTFVRVRVKRVKDGYVAVPLRAQRASLLTSMVNANGIVIVPESVTAIDAGTEVSVALTGDLAT